jgi:hypothetical protein
MPPRKNVTCTKIKKQTRYDFTFTSRLLTITGFNKVADPSETATSEATKGWIYIPADYGVATP